jgi:hypothetical protein
MKNNFMMGKQNQTSSLFSLKEQYLQTHNDRGRLYAICALSEAQQRKLTYNNMHMSVRMKFTEGNGIPIIQSYTGAVDFQVCPYTERNKHARENTALHFFQDDYKFYSAITRNLETTTRSIINYGYVFAPDCSLYVDMPKQVNLQAIYHSRFAAAYWQSWGVNVIPVASWGDVKSLSYCFEGLPQHSVIAVCGTGHNHRKGAKVLWDYAVRNLIEQLEPTTLIVYGGNEEDSFGLPVDVRFIPDFIHRKFRNDASTTNQHTLA